MRPLTDLTSPCKSLSIKGLQMLQRSSFFLLLCAILFFGGSRKGYAAGAVQWLEGWRLKSWATYPFERYEAAELPTGPSGRIDEIRVLRGECECFGVVVRGDSPLRDVKVEIVRAGSDEGASDLGVTVWRMGYVHVDEPSGSRMSGNMPFSTGRGDFPDILLESRSGVLRVGRNLQFLVRLETDRGTKPGRREVELRLRYRREAWMPSDQPTEHRMPLAVNVSPVAVPERSPLLNTTYLSPSKFSLGDLSEPERRKHLRMFARSRQTPHPILPAPRVTVRGDRLEVDSGAWESAVTELLDEVPDAKLFLPAWASYPDPRLQGVYFVHHLPASISQKWFGVAVCGVDGSLGESFKNLFAQYLRHFQKVIERHGWGDRFSLATVDEPYTAHTSDRARDTAESNFRLVSELAALYHEHAPLVRPFVTGEPMDGIAGLERVGHWCVRNLGKVARVQEFARKHGAWVTICDNYRIGTDFPAVAPRTLGWLAWSVGARGWLTFEALSGFEDAYEGSVLTYPMVHGPSVWGMGQLFYPTIGQPGLVPSLRWEMMREGAEDYELLTELAGRLAKGGTSEEWVARATEILGKEAHRLAGGVGDPETMSGMKRENPRFQAEVESVRRRAIELLEEQVR